ncbi:MAG: hypothetical protein EA402_11920 [Planctomycetota bacterium]|nr:MAG: hypothetical protein EA402_11920 [Planctomycetota bacterium]
MTARHALFAPLLALFLLAAPGIALTAVENDSQAPVLAAAREANAVYQRHLQTLFRDLSGDDETSRIRAIARLGRSSDLAVVPRLIPLLNPDTESDAIVSASILALTQLRADISQELRMIIQRHPRLRAAAYNGLARLEMWGAEDWRSRSDDSDAALRASGITNLGGDEGRNAPGAGEILAEALLTDSNPHIRRMAAIGLSRLGDYSFGPQLARALTDPNPRVRRFAAEGLAAIGYQEGIPNILMAMQSNVAGDHLARALTSLSGEDFGYDHRSSMPQRQAAIDRAFTWYTNQQR